MFKMCESLPCLVLWDKFGAMVSVYMSCMYISQLTC